MNKAIFGKNLKLTRDLTRKEIEKIYTVALDVDPLPEQVKEIAKTIESEMHNLYNDPEEYISALARLKIFLDPSHPIGQFSKLFRVKALQNVYTPKRLLALDISDMLPEVFLNSKLEQRDKLDIYSGIDQTIKDMIDEIFSKYHDILNPTRQRTTRSVPIKFNTVDKKIAQNHIDIKDLCDNPYWKMKKVNIIVCKENGKFYCLDVEKLLKEYANKGTVTNYFTDQSLSHDIIGNLVARYQTEIEELQKDNDINIGSRTSDEIIDLQQTIERLQKFKKVFNQRTVLEAVELFGMPSMEDTSVGGVENILDNVPSMLQEEFQDILQGELFNVFVDNVNLWLDSNIDEIQSIIENASKEESEEELEDILKELEESQELSDEPMFQELKETSPLLSKIPDVKDWADYDEEEVDWSKPLVFEEPHQEKSDIMVQQILQPNTVTFKIYADYKARLESLIKNYTKKLKNTREISERSRLDELLQDTEKALQDLQDRTKTVDGLKELLSLKIRDVKEELENQSGEQGIEKLYNRRLRSSTREKEELEKYFQELQKELDYIEQK